MNLFTGQNLLEFSAAFKTDDDCKSYLSDIKWEDGYSCLSCANETFQIRKEKLRVSDYK